jgi:hypothetical protein
MQLVKIVALVISSVALFPSVSLADSITSKNIQPRLEAQQESTPQQHNLAISIKDINPVKTESYSQTNKLTISLEDTNNKGLKSTGYNLSNTRLDDGVYNPNSFTTNQFNYRSIKLFEVKFEF